MLVYQRVHTGWWCTYPSEKYEFVSWDDDILNIWTNKIHVPNHQPEYTYIYIYIQVVSITYDIDILWITVYNVYIYI